MVHLNRTLILAKSKALLDPEYVDLQAPIPKQLFTDEATKTLFKSVETAGSAMLWIIIVALVLQVLGSFGAKKFVFEMFIKSLQLILHLPLYTLVIFPGNAIAFVKLTIKVTMFDLLEEFVDWEYFGIAADVESDVSQQI